MVFYFTCRQKTLVYMGRDKEENEELIKYGWDNDLWFHVDDLSSAHVYLRLQDGWTIDTIPEGVLEDCCQLVKANSIQGSKRKSVKIVYTMWSNLKKTGSMDVGQIGFHDESARRYHTVSKENIIINRLKKTKREEHPNLADLQNGRRAELRAIENKNKEANRIKAKEEAEEAARLEAQRNYTDGFFDNREVMSNAHMDSDYEDDFM
eukprot:TRINITY_DN12219_c0_g1_i1.p1 TRINITY_DN12219_c0_g1~~TRINITY_DN12219_c0_g1_i1.p1  ORF type:complete len:207 (+),score=65.16 TRINITY_DN12219_c0_g1_i1:72-692(+)